MYSWLHFYILHGKYFYISILSLATFHDSSSLRFDLFGRIRTCSLSFWSGCCDRLIPKVSESFVVASYMLLLLQHGKFVPHRDVVLVEQANRYVPQAFTDITVNSLSTEASSSLQPVNGCETTYDPMLH
jgi:hypothetical protein